MYRFKGPKPPFPGQRAHWQSLGLTLLEVLIALIVLVVGLLGVIAALPLAARNVEETNTRDRAAVGLQCLISQLFAASPPAQHVSDLALPLISPRAWARDDASIFTQAGQDPPKLFCRDVYLFDPVGVSKNVGHTFPARVAEPMARVPGTKMPPEMPLVARRVQIEGSRIPSLARLFTSRDDLTYGWVSQDDRPTVTGAKGEISYFLSIACADAPDDLNQNSAPDDLNQNRITLDKPVRFQAAAVALFRRQFYLSDPTDTTPPERAVLAGVLATFLGELELELFVKPQFSDYLEEIRVNDWVVLFGWNHDWRRIHHNWYRVVAVGELEQPKNILFRKPPQNSAFTNMVARRVTAVGEEWPESFCFAVSPDPDNDAWCDTKVPYQQFQSEWYPFVVVGLVRGAVDAVYFQVATQ